MRKARVLLFNPRSADRKFRIPNSVLSVAASVEGLFDWVIVDGNREKDPMEKIREYLETGTFFCFGCTVMPGPQLRQAIPFSEAVRKSFPEIHIVWGGYFPSNQPEAVLRSGYVDYIVNGMGDVAFPSLLKLLLAEGRHFYRNITLKEIPHNLIYLLNGNVTFSPKDGIYDPQTLPGLPYTKLNEFYPVKDYLGKTYLGKKTIAYHSSFGCPFTCSFCAVVPIYEARWKGFSAERIFHDIMFLKDHYGGDSIEFHDNNFFVSEKRTDAFSRLMMNEQMIWWGEGRIDTLDKYRTETLERMYASGCRMIFFGAETGSDDILKSMDKGGTQNSQQILDFAGRMGEIGIIPEYSFVLGTPAADDEAVMEQIEREISFIRKVKEVNPKTEIIIYVYSPVPVKGSELYEKVVGTGFRFPEKLEDWISPEWENFDLRKNPLTPWLKPRMITCIKEFETVLNGYYPTVSDINLSKTQRYLISKISGLRYKLQFYQMPYEIKLLQKFWLNYRQPEIQGF